jgi:hypothetical protein
MPKYGELHFAAIGLETSGIHSGGNPAMTVCVAVIAADNIVMGMSDRMLTAGDVQFQPSSSKIWPLTNSVTMMAAGDIGTQNEVHTDLVQRVTAALADNPKEWVRVETVTEWYRQAYFRLQRRRAERRILEPLGLDSETFLSRQSSMHADLVSKLGMELMNFQMPDTATIIAGANPSIVNLERTTAHIFLIRNGAVSCADKVGFGCVGAGAWHANSTLMLAGHTPSTPLSKAVFNMYSAKKRAEVAPGVGSETDTYVVTGLGGYSELRDQIKDATIKAYDVYARENARSQHKAERRLHEHIEQIINPPKRPESQAVDGTQPEASVDGATG